MAEVIMDTSLDDSQSDDNDELCSYFSKFSSTNSNGDKSNVKKREGDHSHASTENTAAGNQHDDYVDLIDNGEDDCQKRSDQHMSVYSMNTNPFSDASQKSPKKFKNPNFAQSTTSLIPSGSSNNSVEVENDIQGDFSSAQVQFKFVRKNNKLERVMYVRDQSVEAEKTTGNCERTDDHALLDNEKDNIGSDIPVEPEGDVEALLDDDNIDCDIPVETDGDAEDRSSNKLLNAIPRETVANSIDEQSRGASRNIEDIESQLLNVDGTDINNESRLDKNIAAMKPRHQNVSVEGADIENESRVVENIEEMSPQNQNALTVVTDINKEFGYYAIPSETVSNRIDAEPSRLEGDNNIKDMEHENVVTESADTNNESGYAFSIDGLGDLDPEGIECDALNEEDSDDLFDKEDARNEFEKQNLLAETVNDFEERHMMMATSDHNVTGNSQEIRQFVLSNGSDVENRYGYVYTVSHKQGGTEKYAADDGEYQMEEEEMSVGVDDLEENDDSDDEDDSDGELIQYFTKTKAGLQVEKLDDGNKSDEETRNNVGHDQLKRVDTSQTEFVKEVSESSQTYEDNCNASTMQSMSCQTSDLDIPVATSPVKERYKRPVTDEETFLEQLYRRKLAEATFLQKQIEKLKKKRERKDKVSETVSKSFKQDIDHNDSKKSSPVLTELQKSKTVKNSNSATVKRKTKTQATSSQEDISVKQTKVKHEKATSNHKQVSVNMTNKLQKVGTIKSSDSVLANSKKKTQAQSGHKGTSAKQNKSKSKQASASKPQVQITMKCDEKSHKNTGVEKATIAAPPVNDKEKVSNLVKQSLIRPGAQKKTENVKLPVTDDIKCGEGRKVKGKKRKLELDNSKGGDQMESQNLLSSAKKKRPESRATQLINTPVSDHMFIDESKSGTVGETCLTTGGNIKESLISIMTGRNRKKQKVCPCCISPDKKRSKQTTTSSKKQVNATSSQNNETSDAILSGETKLMDETTSTISKSCVHDPDLTSTISKSHVHDPDLTYEDTFSISVQESKNSSKLDKSCEKSLTEEIVPSDKESHPENIKDTSVTLSTEKNSENGQNNETCVSRETKSMGEATSVASKSCRSDKEMSYQGAFTTSVQESNNSSKLDNSCEETLLKERILTDVNSLPENVKNKSVSLNSPKKRGRPRKIEVQRNLKDIANQSSVNSVKSVNGNVGKKKGKCLQVKIKGKKLDGIDNQTKDIADVSVNPAIERKKSMQKKVTMCLDSEVIESDALKVTMCLDSEVIKSTALKEKAFSSSVIKKKRGRPCKSDKKDTLLHNLQDEKRPHVVTIDSCTSPIVKRKRGRPRKIDILGMPKSCLKGSVLNKSVMVTKESNDLIATKDMEKVRSNENGSNSLQSNVTEMKNELCDIVTLDSSMHIAEGSDRYVMHPADRSSSETGSKCSAQPKHRQRKVVGKKLTKFKNASEVILIHDDLKGKKVAGKKQKMDLDKTAGGAKVESQNLPERVKMQRGPGRRSIVDCGGEKITSEESGQNSSGDTAKQLQRKRGEKRRHRRGKLPKCFGKYKTVLKKTDKLWKENLEDGAFEFDFNQVERQKKRPIDVKKLMQQILKPQETMKSQHVLNLGQHVGNQAWWRQKRTHHVHKHLHGAVVSGSGNGTHGAVVSGSGSRTTDNDEGWLSDNSAPSAFPGFQLQTVDRDQVAHDSLKHQSDSGYFGEYSYSSNIPDTAAHCCNMDSDSSMSRNKENHTGDRDQPQTYPNTLSYTSPDMGNNAEIVNDTESYVDLCDNPEKGVISSETFGGSSCVPYTATKYVELYDSPKKDITSSDSERLGGSSNMQLSCTNTEGTFESAGASSLLVSPRSGASSLLVSPRSGASSLLVSPRSGASSLLVSPRSGASSLLVSPRSGASSLLVSPRSGASVDKIKSLLDRRDNDAVKHLKFLTSPVKK